ncbi:cryptochrome/photolyase family protein [Frigoriflavimonas asaccharolytica]|uniref:Deoxyribodipyrimidine photo-lyase n=1 Tax=Frigoriflavimonas asaccharolytica TaxID=2735899 RepID=A0A8J8GA83_9FLAO|nr:deoxyribodipyrimidine photo-lyase [Frigoriflavimonas asaccharolytica]NRS91882.1 deoxyribodipyrimidine photo-lyase [Frigoriflavimonas asaccharolytica]
MKDINIFWFRRDLRLDDNHGFYQALKGKLPVLPIFIFDETILELLPNKKDARVEFIYNSLEEMNKILETDGHQIQYFLGKPEEIFEELNKKYNLKCVFANEDYEPQAIARDVRIKELLEHHQSDFQLFKDQVIFHKDEVMKADGKPYTIYTPYSKIWLKLFKESNLEEFPSIKLLENLLPFFNKNMTLQDIGFEETSIPFPEGNVTKKQIQTYDENRNLPAKDATTRLSLHLRFGTKSIRKIIKETKDLNEVFLKELIWREFFMQILYHFPKVVHNNFKSKYDGIEWKENAEDLKKWCEGKTGFPIVDAGMRELNTTGFMHNRVRMITASFLVKDLLIDWRVGEAYFAEKLLDYELSSNNGNWQWAAGTGCDSAPYFRIFNPTSQQEKFDPDFKYIKKWVPEFGTDLYPKPIVDHKEARLRTLDAYKKGLQD